MGFKTLCAQPGYSIHENEDPNILWDKAVTEIVKLGRGGRGGEVTNIQRGYAILSLAQDVSFSRQVLHSEDLVATVQFQNDLFHNREDAKHYQWIDHIRKLKALCWKTPNERLATIIDDDVQKSLDASINECNISTLRFYHIYIA
jgi:hypothetical protein